MNLVLLSIKMLRRDWRAGELRILALALIIAVSSITTVGFFADRVQLALAQESNRLLGADLVVTSDRPIPIEFTTQAESFHLKIVNLIRFPSMVSKGDHNLLAEIRAVSPGYPLRGELKIMDRPNESAMEEHSYLAEGIPAQGTIWIDDKLLLGLKTALSEKLEVGIAEMAVTSIIAREPDHSVGFINMGPRLLMNIADLAGTQLIQPGSRVSYQLLVAGKESDVTQFRDWAQPKLVQGQRVEGIRDARPEIRAALERAEKFLSLAALVSVIVAAAAIALSSRRFIQRHLDGCAVMRCLGASQSTLFSLYFYHLVLFGLIASTIGCVLGLIAQAFLSNWMAELVNSTLPWPSSDPAIYGLIMGIVLLLGFSLPPLLNLKSVPALRVIRRDMGSVNLHSLTGYSLGLLVLALLFIWEAGDLRLGLMVVLGFIGAIAVFSLLGWLLIQLLLLVRRHNANAWGYGLANIRRRIVTSVVQAIALGLGLMAMLVLTVLQNDLLKDWQLSLPPETPNRFLLNIQTDQLASLAKFFEQHEMPEPNWFPMVRGRLTAINGYPVQVEKYKDIRKKQLLNREFNLSWSNELQSDNEITDGRWWSENQPMTESEISLEEEIARIIGVNIGDRLTFNIADQLFEATITNLRKVDWDTFRVNFFAIARPGYLENYPTYYVTSFHLPADKSKILHELIREYPNLLIIDVASVIEQVQKMIFQVSRAIEFVFVFTLLAGFVVLYAAIVATQDERVYEAAIFRTLGARRNQLVRAWASEFMILGALVGIFASAGATVLGYTIGKYALHITYSFNPWIWIIGLLIGMVGVMVAGLIGTRFTLAQPPLLTLRRLG